MKKILFIILLLQNSAIFSQKYYWDNVLEINGNFPFNNLSGKVICIDKTDNKILVSSFVNTISINNINLSTDSNGIFLLKTSKDDSILWLKKIVESNTQNIGVPNLTIDIYNNIYFSIGFSDSILFDNTIYKAKVSIDVILVKLDSNGNVLFKKQFIGSNNEFISLNGLSTYRNNNNIFLLGSVSDSIGSYIVFDNDTIFNKTNSQIFVTKLDSSGNHLFTHTISSVDIGPSSLYIDNHENMYISGSSYSLLLKFDTILYSTPNYSTHAFVSRFSSNGNFEWARSMGMDVYPSSVYTHKVVGYGGKIFVTGYCFSNIPGTLLFENAGGLNTNGGGNFFIACYDSLGNLLWKKLSNSGGTESVPQAITDDNGNLYVSGFFSAPIICDDTVNNIAGKDLLFIQLDSMGNYIQSMSAGGTSNDLAQGMVMDSHKNIYIAGGTSSSPCTFGSTDIYPTFASSIFLAKLTQTPTSIQETTLSHITLYPNPAHTEFVLSSSNILKGNLYVYNTLGQLLLSQKINASKASISTSTLPNGMYIVQFKNEQNSFTQK